MSTIALTRRSVTSDARLYCHSIATLAKGLEGVSPNVAAMLGHYAQQIEALILDRLDQLEQPAPEEPPYEPSPEDREWMAELAKDAAWDAFLDECNARDDADWLCRLEAMHDPRNIEA